MSVLMGRDRDLDVLLGCLEEAEQGRAGVVVCVGETGIGKSRLADELTRMARSRGAVVVWGRAATLDGAPPYRPWLEVMRALPAVGAADASVRPRILEMTGEPSLEERMRWFDDVAEVVLQAAQSAVLVVVLDDADAADAGSQLLARHLARSARAERLLLVMTCRDTPGPLSELAQEPHVTQLEVRGLDRTDAGRLIASILAREATEAELTAVMEATTGNPFFVAELARHLSEYGDMDGVPRSVRDTVRVRLARLTPTCTATLEAAAVVGVSFPVPVVGAMTGVHAPDLLEAFDEAVGAALVTRPVGSGEWRFTHAVVRDAIVAGLDTARRVALHRRAAEVIEAQHQGHSSAVIFALARHWTEAAVAGGASPAPVWTERAAREAMRQHAYEDACGWFTRALSLGADLEDEARCQLTLGLACAQALSADMPGALRSCQEVIDLAVGLGLPELVGESALVVDPTFDPQIDRLIRGMCEQALGMLGPDQAGLRARVLAAYAVVCDHLSDVEEAERAVDEALSLVGDGSDVKAMEAALIGHHMVRSGPDGLAEREVNAARMAELGTRADRPELLLASAEWRFDAAAERGDLPQAGRELEAIARWASRVGGPISRWRVLSNRAVLAQARGQLAEAKRYGDDALKTVAATGFPPAFMLYSGFLANLGHHIGYSSETLHALGMGVDPAEREWPLEGVVLTLGPATVLADLGRTQEAARLYRRLGPASEWRETPHGALFTWAIGLATATAVGADDDVVTLRGKLGAFRGHHIVNGRYAMAYLGPAELWLGIGATHLGLVDDAIADLESATKACAANGAEGFRAEAEYELARALARRSAPGDGTRARSLAIDAQRRCAELRMPPILEKTSALIARLQAEPGVRLSPRESEVAALVAEGRTNRQIASLLFISERTAQNHVQHILDKLDLPNRSQIAVWVERTGNEYVTE